MTLLAWKGASFSIHTNPSTASITITKDQERDRSFQLFDLSGRSVFTTQLNQAVETIDLGHLQNGVYLFELNDNRQGKLILND